MLLVDQSVTHENTNVLTITNIKEKPGNYFLVKIIHMKV